MAFTSRATRLPPSNTESNADVGPGLYISPDFMTKKVSPNKVPFQTSVFRENKLKQNDSLVGPGYYYRDDRHENFLKMINKDTEKKKNPLYRSIDVDKQTPFGFYLAEDLRQKSGFMSKDRRFRQQSIDSDIPGPGSYNFDKKLNKSPSMTSRIKPLKNIVDEHNIELVGSPKRIVTIPTKRNCYGYEVRGDSVIRMNQNPDSGRMLSGTLNDSAGPGQYDVASPDYWLKKKGTQWSKYKTGRSQTISTANKSTAGNSNVEDFEFSNEKRIKEELNKENRKLEKIKMLQLFKEQGRRRRSLANEFHGVSNKSMLENIASQSSPGPGYYIDIYEHSSFKRDPVPEKLQKFGSGSQRFIPDHVTIEGSVGPGAYFVDDINAKKFKQASDRIKKSPPFLSSQKRESQTQGDISPGPASYNLDKYTNKVLYENTKCIFGSSEIRLPERAEKKSPGPGSYIPLEKWNKITTNDILKMMKPKFQENIKIKEEKDVVSNIPPVGTYNTDINSINYKVEKKNSKFNSVNAPFLSVNKRFKYKTSNQNVGPGMYELEGSLGKKSDKEFHPPFLQSDNRFKTDKNMTINGPGAYNHESYFNWNKKSYNILYYN